MGALQRLWRLVAAVPQKSTVAPKPVTEVRLSQCFRASPVPLEPAILSRATVARLHPDTLGQRPAHEDLVEAFVRDCLIKCPGAKLRANDVYAAYASYCAELCLVPGSQTLFGRCIRKLSVKAERKNNRVFYHDIRLRKAAPIEYGVDD
ncbi:MAG: hypothetical protein ACKVP3_23105 [Hyphomicrobiaceae bacterium]